MHISEGLLNPAIIAPTWVATAAITATLLWHLKTDEIPRIAAFCAIFFIASFVHFPLGATSIHLMLSGLVGVMLGANAFLAIFVGLLLQGVLFGFGGLTSLGANALAIGLPAMFLGVFRGVKFGGFAAGFLAIFASTVLVGVLLLLNGEEFKPLARLLFVANAPLMLVEGFVTIFVLEFVKRFFKKDLR